jgi:hypothetical protein
MKSYQEIPMFKDLLKQLKDLHGTQIQIYGSGRYPTKQRTKVQDVAKYQNDGTDRGIKPAKFVEKAARKARSWKGPVYKAATEIMFRNANMKQALEEAGLKMSFDINRMINRIKTGRLKASMRPRIVRHGAGRWHIRRDR